MLKKYKDEEKVFLINGTNEGAKEASANSYSFKRVYDIPEDVTQLWGWGSWKRAWKKHDKEMSKLQEYKKRYEYQNTYDNDEYLKNRRISVLANQMEHILSGRNKTWDLQFKFSILINDGLIIVPDCNLVTNIGCGASNAAHGAFEYTVGGTLAPGEVLFPASHPKNVLPQPLTTKQCLRAAYMPVFKEKEFWDMETRISNEILDVHNFLVKRALNPEQFSKMFDPFLSEKLFNLINICVSFREFDKAQKYLYLALTRSLLRGENNVCSKCEKRECLPVCPSNCISLFQTQEKEVVVNIDRKACRYCFNCMKICRVVKQR
jgi:ferredoxin-like protein FixX